MTAIIIDTETTDNDPAIAQVVEFGWREFHLDGTHGKTGAALYGLLGGEETMKWGALATHHILPGELTGLEPFDLARHPEADAADYWIGHNIDFDWKCVGAPARPKRICTLAMARTVWPHLDSHSLSAIVYYLLGPTPQTRERLRHAHSAADDCALCEVVLRKVVDATKPDSLEDLYQFSEESRIPRIMTFGKFKDQPIENVDRGYANWYRRQPDTDPYLLEAFRRQGLI